MSRLSIDKKNASFDIKREKALKHYFEESKAEEKQKQLDRENILESNVYTAISNPIRTSKNRVNRFKVANSYYNNMLTRATSQFLTRLVEESLLLDESYLENNPDFRKETRMLIENIVGDGDGDTEPRPIIGAAIDAILEKVPKYEEVDHETEETLDVMADDIGDSVYDEQRYDSADEDFPEDDNEEEFVTEHIQVLKDEITDRIADAIAEQKDFSINYNRVLEESLNEDFSGFIQDNKEKTLLESLAYNDAMKQIDMNNDYNIDHAIENSIALYTVLETMDVCGLIKLTPETKKTLLDALK